MIRYVFGWGKFKAIKQRLLSTTQIVENAKNVRVISLDVTGTLMVFRHPIKCYSDAAIWAKLENPPSYEEVKLGFKIAFKKHHHSFPCYGFQDNLSERDWWYKVVRLTLESCGRNYSDNDFNRYFRKVYQHFARSDAYDILDDAKDFLNSIENSNQSRDDKYSLGILTNSGRRTIDTVLPMLGLQQHFKWFVSCRDIGYEKPNIKIFDAAFNEAKFWIPSLERHHILHIGDNFAGDYCGARAAGFQSLYLDRSSDKRVINFQDWLLAPDYPDKSWDDIERHTVKNFQEVKKILLI
jgi:REG-2-like HAD superfamily hydrolase